MFLNGTNSNLKIDRKIRSDRAGGVADLITAWHLKNVCGQRGKQSDTAHKIQLPVPPRDNLQTIEQNWNWGKPLISKKSRL